jgi:anti-anti-sigma regulatory factor
MITEEPLSNTKILVKFSGNISPEEIQQTSNKIVQSPYRTVIIDLSEVYHLNYAVLVKLHILNLDLTTRSKRLAFHGCSERLSNVLKLLNFDKTVQILMSSPQQHQTEKKRRKWGKEF